jgi:SnoaL-like domain
VRAWREHDFAALKALWDTSQPPVYLPEEARKPCLTWDELDRYWAFTRDAAKKVSIRIADVEYRSLAPDLVSALYAMHWNFATHDEQLPVGGDVRVFAVFRRLSAGWAFVQYIEAPLAPIVYVRSLYEQQVDSDFSR